MCGQRWCIGSWVEVIDSLSVGLCHAGCVRAAKKVQWGIHMWISSDFKETYFGLTRKDGKRVNAPPTEVNKAEL